MKTLIQFALAALLAMAVLAAGCDSSGGSDGTPGTDVTTGTDTGVVADTGTIPGTDVVAVEDTGTDPVEDIVAVEDTGTDPVEDIVAVEDTGTDPVEDIVTVEDTATVEDTGSTTTCSGSCDPTTDTDITCLEDGGTLCYCNSETSTWSTYSCADLCADNGAEGDQCSDDPDELCACTYNCDDATAVQASCDEYTYTPCTCATADPCGWAADGYCDLAYCEANFPDQDNFDDKTADCIADCTDTDGVTEACDNYMYNNCTCAVADPCSWASDGYCDYDLCNGGVFSDQENFDDSASDCQE